MPGVSQLANGSWDLKPGEPVSPAAPDAVRARWPSALLPGVPDRLGHSRYHPREPAAEPGTGRGRWWQLHSAAPPSALPGDEWMALPVLVSALVAD